MSDVSRRDLFRKTALAGAAAMAAGSVARGHAVDEGGGTATVQSDKSIQPTPP